MSAEVPVLATERLVLRDWRDADRVPFAGLNGDPDVMRHFPAALTVDQSGEMVDRMTSAWQRKIGRAHV